MPFYRTISILIAIFHLSTEIHSQSFDHLNNDSVNIISYYDVVDDNIIAQNSDTKLYGILDTFGQVVVPFLYDELSQIKGNRTIAIKKGLYGVVNLENDIVIPFEYDNLVSSLNQRFIYLKKDEKGIRDLNNSYSLKQEFTSIKSVKDQLFIAESKTKPRFRAKPRNRSKVRYWLLDSLGNQLIPNQDFLDYRPHSNVIVSSINDKYGLIDTKGVILLENSFKTISYFKNGLAYIKKNDKYGFIDSLGSLKIPLKYDHAYMFENERAIIQYEGKWGIINTNGNYILPPIYSRIYYSKKDQLYFVESHKKYFLLDYNFSRISNLEFDDIRLTNSFTFQFKSDLLSIQVNGLWGYINRNGSIIIEPKFKDVREFEGEYAIIGKFHQNGLIDKKGQIVLKPEFKNIQITSSNEVIAKKNNKSLVISKDKILSERLEGSIYKIKGKHLYIWKDKNYWIADFYGKVLTPGKFDIIESEAHDRVILSKDNLKGFYDLNSKKYILPLEFEDIEIWYSIRKKGAGAIIVKSKNGMGLYDGNGRLIIKPEMEDIKAMTYGILVKQNGKYGLYDKSCNKLTDIIYDKIKSLSGDKLKLYLNGEFQLINPYKFIE